MLARSQGSVRQSRRPGCVRRPACAFRCRRGLSWTLLVSGGCSDPIADIHVLSGVRGVLTCGARATALTSDIPLLTPAYGHFRFDPQPGRRLPRFSCSKSDRCDRHYSRQPRAYRRAVVGRTGQSRYGYGVSLLREITPEENVRQRSPYGRPVVFTSAVN